MVHRGPSCLAGVLSAATGRPERFAALHFHTPVWMSNVAAGDDDRLSPDEQAMARWARKVARGPNHTTDADVQELRDAGFSEAHIFAMTAYVALRIAFSTVNDALGARPDAALRSTAPEAVLEAVAYGRPSTTRRRWHCHFV